MARLWLDEMIPGEVARQLRRLGHDVERGREFLRLVEGYIGALGGWGGGE